MCNSLELKRLIELQKEANSIFNKLHSDMNTAVQAYADVVRNKISILSKQCTDSKLRYSRYEYHWALRYSHFVLELDTDGYVQVYFIERGCRGNSDETVHSMEFKPEFFTTEGRAQMIDELEREELRELSELKVEHDLHNIKRISELEKELNLLKGATK